MRFLQRLSYPFRRQPRRPLAARRPECEISGSVPLGLEETDLSLINDVTRRNDALERPISSGARRGGPVQSSLAVRPMPEDETYAARYHRAFLTKGK